LLWHWSIPTSLAGGTVALASLLTGRIPTSLAGGTFTTSILGLEHSD
jgi:hypothetical protein